MQKARKLIIFILLGIVYVLFQFIQVKAENFVDSSYAITQFKSDIEIQKDTTVKVIETIQINFPEPRHGIYRIIPIMYSVRGKTINAKFKLLSITDENGNSYKYEEKRAGQSVSLKIGDSEKSVTGLQTYVITYSLKKVIQRYEEYDELYWNVTGSEWDTDIYDASASVSSAYATISRVECFAGSFGGSDRFCQSRFSSNNATLISTTDLGSGRDFTIVVALDKDNNLVFPSRTQSFFDTLIDNWGYLASIIPFLTLLYFWLKKGRDQKYANDNIYYKPVEAKVVTKPLFTREFLPTVYHPIQALTPSEVGTIVDEKVDIHDIVSEIIELARLGFIKIEKIEKDELVGKHKDYAFINLKKETAGLKDFQVYLLEKLFDEKLTSKTIKEAEKIYKKDNRKLKEVLKLASSGEYVLLSSLKNSFYENLDKFRKKLYESLDKKLIFDGKPDKIKEKWISIYIFLEILSVVAVINFVNLSGNYVPLILLIFLSIPTLFFALAMPRRTAWGYSLYRQIKGLAFYLQKGKWREEIAEKNLFFEEMLPLAISLGIVDKLAGDMQSLGVEPPKYFAGVTTGTLSSDIGVFAKTSENVFVSAPGGKWSGASSWSGGSGFSGGASGGGFGGGGGGSW
ncbi:MAG: DUF2207 domain-containing protein [Candidatus Jordarchaeaceae archaeon]